jgi:hypothetical protein
VSSSFTRLATATASTRRPPAIVAGKRDVAAAYLDNLKCLPLMPVSEELRARLGLLGAAELLQTALQGSPDIREGDILITGTLEYQVRSVADWPWIDGTLTRFLVLEQSSVDKYGAIP